MTACPRIVRAQQTKLARIGLARTLGIGIPNTLLAAAEVID